MKNTTIEMMLKGMDMIREALVSEMNASDIVGVDTSEVKDNKVVELKGKMSKKEAKEEVVAETKEEAEVEAPTNDIAKLNAMTMAELKEIAKGLGVAVRGTKSAIIGRILEAQDTAEDVVEEEVEEVEETEVVGEEELEVEEDLETQLAEYTLEELAEMLTDVGISAKGKKQALIAKVVKAVEEGKIAFEEEDEDAVEEVEETEEEGIDVTEVLQEVGMKDLKTICKELGIKVKLSDKKPKLIEMINEFKDEEKVVNVLVAMELIDLSDVVEEEEADTEEEIELVAEGSDERIKVVEDNFADLQESLDTGETTTEEVIEFLEDYYSNNKSELKKLEAMDDETKATMFCWIQANLVDDEGEEVEFNEPYMVGETPYCCGRAMKKLSKGTYLCEIDGEEVEIEE